MRDTKSLLLVLLSTGLMGTWVYHLYDKTKYSNQRHEIYIKDSIAVAEGVQDSLQKIYASTIDDLDEKLDSAKYKASLLKGELSNKLSEIYRLRNEISNILKKNDVKKEDLALARRKSNELQGLVQELKSKNNSIEEEKHQISVLLDNVNIQVKTLEGNLQQATTNVQQLTKENKILVEKVAYASTFSVSNIALSPVTVKNDKERETSSANNVSKLIVSFAVRNNITDETDAEVYVIVTQPDGRVLKNDVWEAFSIDTKKDGKKSYTRRVRFEYEKGENKQLLFSLNANEYLKGNYKLQVYHNGYMIGQTNKVLN